MKKILTLFVLLFTLSSCSYSIPKISKVHIISENKCYKATTSVYSAKYYVYVNGNRYRRHDVIILYENEKCPYCDN